MKRRSVLKSVAGAGLATASSLGRVLGANDRVRVGLIGNGLIGKRHLLDFKAQPDVEIAAVCELSEERLAEAASAAGNDPARYKDFSDLKPINRLRPGEETTIVATVWDVKSRRIAANNRHLLTVVLSDTTGTVQCTFFNQPYLQREFQGGELAGGLDGAAREAGGALHCHDGVDAGAGEHGGL